MERLLLPTGRNTEGNAPVVAQCSRINQYASRVESTKLTKDWQTSIKILSDFGI
uniref:Uncharacterized protein n=1 Tax=Oryza sativa subsp. japonica TaxID=39947 RepID=Q6ZA25_ORYSJ|nr:hypothetical protein [Oryza sativa Japonica Group]